MSIHQLRDILHSSIGLLRSIGRRSLLFLTFFYIPIFLPLEGVVSIGISTSANYIGDREAAWRIKIAAERLGWKVILDEEEGKNIQHHHLDWVICMLPDNQFLNPHCPNYLMVFHPFNYLDDTRRFKTPYNKYDGYLLTINDRESLREGLEQEGKEFYYIPFYPTCCSTSYRKNELNELMVMIPTWGSRLKSNKYKSLFHWLSQTGYTKFYGPSANKEIIQGGYMGSIPFDGTSVIHALQKHGMNLIIHSDVHNAEAIPSGRIFEAAAASSVIISDKNPFVIKHFGDSVLYIDTSETSQSIFEQINEHMLNIKMNGEDALKKAIIAHKIFSEKFTMEKQLLSLKKMHKKLIQERLKKL